MKMTSPYEKVIRRDISRTYPEHDFFKERHGVGQERLFNVIKVRNVVNLLQIKIRFQAYSLYDREVGYCQGIAFLVGLLLMHVSAIIEAAFILIFYSQMPEEEAFAVLVAIMQDFTMRDMYKPDMFYLGLCIYQLECMVQVCYFYMMFI